MSHRFSILCWSIFLTLITLAIQATTQDSKYVPGSFDEEHMINAPACYSPQDPWLASDAGR